MPLLVDRADLAGAVSLNSVMINASRVLGPALAAVLALFGVDDVAAVPRQRRHVPVPDRRHRRSCTSPTSAAHHPEQGWRRLLTGINIARGRAVLGRCLVTMCVFSVVCLVYVGLFPSVARRNFGIDVDSAGYKLLYTTWGVGACLGALAVGTVLAHVDRRRLVVDGMLLFAVSLGRASPSCARPGRRIPVAFVLGFAYFLTATSLITIFQENLADTERAARDAAVVHGVRRLDPDRQPDLRPGDRRHRRPLGARPRRRRRRRAGPLVRPAPAAGRARSCRPAAPRTPTDRGPVAGHGVVAD